MNTVNIDQLSPLPASRTGTGPPAAEAAGRHERFDEHLRDASGPALSAPPHTERGSNKSVEPDQQRDAAQSPDSAEHTDDEAATQQAESPRRDEQDTEAAGDTATSAQVEQSGDSQTDREDDPSANAEVVVAVGAVLAVGDGPIAEDDTAPVDVEVTSFDASTLDPSADDVNPQRLADALEPTVELAGEFATDVVTSELAGEPREPAAAGEPDANESADLQAATSADLAEQTDTVELEVSSTTDDQVVTEGEESPQLADATATLSIEVHRGEDGPVGDQQSAGHAEQDDAETDLPTPADSARQRRPARAESDAALPIPADVANGSADDQHSQSLTAAVLERAVAPVAEAAAQLFDRSESSPEGESDAAARHTAAPSETGRADVPAGTVHRWQQAVGRAANNVSGSSQNSGPRVDTARFVSRVARAFRIAQDRGGSLQLRLSPPELGSLRLEVTVHHGGLSARIEAETSAARNALLDNLPALRDRLAEQNLRIERFDVDVRDEGGQSQQFNFQHGSDNRAPQAGRIHTAARTNHGVEVAEQTRTPRVMVTDGVIDLFI